MVLAVLHEHSELATVWCRILFRGISPVMRGLLGVPDPPDEDDAAGHEAAYRNVRTRFHSLLAPIDPSPFPKDRRLTPEDSLPRSRRSVPATVSLMTRWRSGTSG
jgi:hypothetical protein